MNKFLKIIGTGIITVSLLTGCFKRDTMDNINIISTTYPIKNLVDKIYGYNSTITSIYPNGVNKNEYKPTEKQIKEYSTTDMFIYNGLTPERQIAANLLNQNKNLKIIDVTRGLSIQRDEEELWLSPSNYLMLAQNIKNELEEYIKATIVKQEIENNYTNLKLIISSYDAEFKLIAENAQNKVIIVGNDVFKFLEKYGFTVLSVEENATYNATEYNMAKTNIEAKTNKSVFVLDTDSESNNINKLKELGANIVPIHSMTILKDIEVESNLNYEKMMDDFIEKLKTEAYN